MKQQNDKYLYRSRDGIFLGVCKGLANYSEIKVIWFRLALLVFVGLTAFVPVALLYIAAAVIMKPEPVVAFDNESERDFYDNWTSDRSNALSALLRKFRSLDRRTQRLESIITNKEYDWDRRLNQRQ